MRRFFRGKIFPCLLFALLVFAGTVALAIYVPVALAPLAAAERVFSLIAGVFLLLLPDAPEYKTARLLILTIPWMGSVFCLLSLPKKANSAGEIVSCHAETSDYFPLGEEMKNRLLEDIAAARSTIWLQYYIIEEGIFFGEIFSLLKEKAKEGVDVRILYDDFGCSLTLPRAFKKKLSSAGVKARALRPLSPVLSAGRREHRKIASIDFFTAYTGGINLADEYIGKKIRFGHWKDTAVRVTGDAALALSSLFARTWGGLSVPAPKGGECNAEVFSDPAEHTFPRCGAPRLCSLIGSAKCRVFLFTPYLAPDHALLSALAEAAKGGADVRLMIPHRPDKRLPFLVTRSYARALQKLGVSVREYTAGFLHAKSVLSDGALSVSTYNADFRSFYLQSECGVLLTKEDVVMRAEEDFLTCWEQGSPVPEETAFRRFLGATLRIFAPLL